MVATENLLCRKRTHRKCTLTKMYTEIVHRKRSHRKRTTKFNNIKIYDMHHVLTENVPLSIIKRV